ncbi:thioredoxin reductase [Talaromyces pinophilus]|uniref:Thioredoxin reductase n=1 Tax=Talaromyces pinophilus TaxID=128442 RepID=A0A0B8N2R5_TALPI|nr:thioredoxin reductase [Talaromyces pinophilus]
MSAPLFDALIIGAGPAGLSAATGLARQLHTTAIFNTSVFRSSKTKHMHNVVGWDHRDPAEFRAKARQDLLARYSSTVQFHDCGIESVSKRDDGSHHCLFCDGYEKRGARSAGVLATDLLQPTQRTMHVSHMAKRLVDNVTIYTNGNSEQASTLQEAIANLDGFRIDSRAFARLEKRETDAEPKIIIHFEDGSSAEEAFLAHGPKYVLNGPFAEQLGLETIESGEIKATPMFNETSMPGAFAIGDCATPMKAVTPAIYMGSGTAAAIVMQLQQEK